MTDALDTYYGQSFGQKQAEEAENELGFNTFIRPNKLDPNKWHWFRAVPLKREWVENGVKTPFFTIYKHIYTDPNDPNSTIVYLCPNKSRSLPCSDCVKAAALRRKPKDSPEREMGMDMSPKHMKILAVIDVANPDAGVQLLEMSAPNGKPSGKSQFERLTTTVRDPDDGGDILHPVEGFNFAIKKTGSGFGTEYSFKLAKETSPLHEDRAKIVELIEGQPDIPAMIREEIERGIEVEASLRAGNYRPGRPDDVMDTQAAPGYAALPPTDTAEDDVYGDLDDGDDVQF